MHNKVTFFRILKICKYDPIFCISPYIKNYCYFTNNAHSMLLDELFLIKKLDSLLSFRRSCREGICGSCAMNINGVNTLSCIYAVNTDFMYTIYPLAHLPIIKDLVVSLKHFYYQYKSIKPWVSINNNISNSSIRQHKNQRNLLNGLYECILCACCSTSCPSYWWNSDYYLGPAILLQAFRWIVDSRDINTFDRLYDLNDTFKLYRCHSIMNCSKACPKNLNPALAISNIKKILNSLFI